MKSRIHPERPLAYGTCRLEIAATVFVAVQRFNHAKGRLSCHPIQILISDLATTPAARRSEGRILNEVPQPFGPAAETSLHGNFSAAVVLTEEYGISARVR